MSEVGAEKALGKAIQEARKKAGLTQQALCMKANLSYSTLAKIERGAIRSPSVFTVTAVAAATGVSVEELVGSLPDFGRGAGQSFKRSKSGISFVYFDVNGVLVRFYQRVFARLAEDIGSTSEAVENAFWRYGEDVCRGEMDVEDLNRKMAALLNVTSIDWRKYYLESVDPIEEAQEVLRWAAQHYRVGLLSNIMPGFIDALFDSALLPRLAYQVIADSSQIGAVKPEPQIFEKAAEMAGVPANEILFIDDERSNLMAAERIGWRVLWFDNYTPGESAERIKDALAFD